jgi:hypothetical protein
MFGVRPTTIARWAREGRLSPGRPRRPGLRDQPRREQQTGQADRHVDQEGGLPRQHNKSHHDHELSACRHLGGARQGRRRRTRASPARRAGGDRHPLGGGHPGTRRTGARPPSSCCAPRRCRPPAPRCSPGSCPVRTTGPSGDPSWGRDRTLSELPLPVTCDSPRPGNLRLTHTTP